MQKQTANQLINKLEAVKGLITNAQNHLDDGNFAEAEKELNEVTNGLYIAVKISGGDMVGTRVTLNKKPNISTETT